MRVSTAFLSACLVFSLSLAGCGGGDDEPSPADDGPDAVDTTLTKVTFDLDRLNEDGLVGPPDGLRSVSYEFCIPSDEAAMREVRDIDPTVQCHAGSPGRIGCTEEQVLCIGETAQPDWREVLTQLASLDYVQRIDESFAE